MKKTMIYAALAVVLASCSSEQVTNPTIKGDVKLDLIGNVTGEVNVTTKANVALKATTVGVYAVGHTTPAFDNALTQANHLYSVDAAGAFSSTDFIQLKKGEPYDAIAYAPYKLVITNPNAVAFVHGDDVLYAPTTVVNITAAPGKASVVLPFAHKMAQVKFKLIAGTGLVEADLVNATVSVSGFYDGCAMDLSTGVLAASSTKTAKIETEQSPGVVLATTAIVPGDVILSYVINVKGTQYKYIAPAAQTFAAGKSTTLNLTLIQNNTTLDVVTGTVADWEVSTPVDVTIQN